MPTLAAILLALAAPPAAPSLAVQWAAAAPQSAAALDPLRGAFPGAEPSQAAAWRTLDAFAEACLGPATEAARSDLRGLGYEATALHRGSYRDQVCGAALTLTQLPLRYASRQTFDDAVREAWPVYAAYIAAVRNAEILAEERSVREPGAPAGDSRGTAIGEALRAHLVGEQVLRLAFARGTGNEAASIPISEAARPVFEALIDDAIGRRDRANTEWLRHLVARSGWPTRTVAGEKGAEAAWLLVQHADLDPAFQARMLGLMAPLAARGEVSKKEYALLYDRVMIKVAGRQRYATQYSCKDGRMQPRPLEDPARADALRAEAGLDSVAQNTARIQRLYGNGCR